MKKIIFVLAAGFIMGLVGASAVLADGTNSNSNTNSGGGTVTNVSWGYIHCVYSGKTGPCAVAPQQVPNDPDGKTKG